MRAGLAGSTALIATVVGALNAFTGVSMSPYHVAEIMRKIEYSVMGIMCGLQDQHMTVFGGLNFMDFAGKEELMQRDDEPAGHGGVSRRASARAPLLLAHTGIQHDSGTVHSSPRQRWLDGEPLVRQNYTRFSPRLRDEASEPSSNRTGRTLGALMNDNHRLVAEVGGSGPANEALIEAARASGAIGAKLAGAGGGGTIIALTTEPERVGEALRAAGADCLLTPVRSRG